MSNIELRFNENVSIDVNENSMTVEGYANITETPSELLTAKDKKTKKPIQFIETIKKGAFMDSINSGQDIHLLLQHDKDKVLASTRNGSLQITEDDRGLKVRANIVPTSFGKDTLELIKSRIYKGMSFGFIPIDSSIEKVGEIYKRTIKKLKLFEVSVVRDPAYSNSIIEARAKEEIELEIKEERQLDKNYFEDLGKSVVEATMKITKELEELREKNGQLEKELEATKEVKEEKVDEVVEEEVKVEEKVDEVDEEKRSIEDFKKILESLEGEK